MHTSGVNVKKACVLSNIDLRLKLFTCQTMLVPVGACIAALGMVALSSGTELVSGSGVLLVGDVGIGSEATRCFLCFWK